MTTIAIVNLPQEPIPITDILCAVVSNLFVSYVLPVVGNGNMNNLPLAPLSIGRISLKLKVPNAAETFNLKIIKME